VGLFIDKSRTVGKYQNTTAQLMGDDSCLNLSARSLLFIVPSAPRILELDPLFLLPRTLWFVSCGGVF